MDGLNPSARIALPTAGCAAIVSARVAGLVVIVLVVGRPAGRAAEPAPLPADGGEIGVAWAQRREALGQVRARWREVAVFPKGSLSGSSPELIRPPGAVVPPADARFEHEVECVLDGRRFQLQGPETSWNFDRGKFVTAQVTVTYDGTRTTRVVRDADEPGEQNNSVERAGFQPSWVPVARRTWLTAVRTGDPVLATFTTPPRLALEPGEADVNGARCRVLVKANPAGLLDYRYWVEPAADYRIRKLVSYDLGRPVREELLSYADPGGRAIPQPAGACRWSRAVGSAGCSRARSCG